MSPPIQPNSPLPRTAMHISPAPETVAVLMVTTSPEDARDLDLLLGRVGWSLDAVSTVGEAIERASAAPVPIIVTDVKVADGNWESLLAAVGWTKRAPRIVVSAKLADERLWSEVLNLGAFDLLNKPFEHREVYHVLGHAWSSWRRAHCKVLPRPQRIGPSSDRSAAEGREGRKKAI